MVRALVQRTFVALLAAAALVLSASPADAQSAVFTGRVLSSGQPVGGATVSLPELGVGAITSLDGRYSFTVDVSTRSGRTVNLTARFIGYRPKAAPVTLAAGRTEKDFDLEKDVLNLEQVVVTGVSDATSTRKTAFSVGVVDAEQLKASPASSPIMSLAGKVAGADVTVGSSAQPGSEPAIRLRASTAMTGRQDPLVIVDGTITRLGLADINTQDVERVEVIKGAAASSLYGSDAANGVIQIFTRRGANLAEGQRIVTVRNEVGSSWLPKMIARNNSHEYDLDAAGKFSLDANGNRVPSADRIADNAYPAYFDHNAEVFRKSLYMTNYLSVGERRGSTNFAASFENQKETGILQLLSGYGRQNFRLNVDHTLNDEVDFSAGAFYGRSTADQVSDQGLGVLFGMRFLEPNVDIKALNKDGSPYNAVIKQPPLSGNVINPLYGLANNNVTNDRDRFTGTFKARYRPVLWLTAEANFNYDVSNANGKNFTPLGYLNSSGASGTGRLSQAVTNQRAYNTGLTLTSVRETKWFTNTSKAAFVYEDQFDNQVRVLATALTVPKVTEFAAASLDPNNPVQPASFTQATRNKNVFFVTTFDIKDKYIIDGLVRRDESSLFGAEQRGATYHRLSAAYRVSEDFRIPGVDELKLRASYGTAGLRPVWDAQYEQFAIIGGSPTKVTLGNPDLKPAYSREYEYGFNLNFLRNYTVEYSYSDKITSDQILNVPVSSATGYQNRWTNAGTLAGQTHEVALAAVLLSRKDMFWRVNLAADRTRQKITDLKVGPFLVGPNGTNGGGDANTRIFRIAKGEPFGIIYGSKWIRTADELATTITAKGLTGTAADYVVNEEGLFVSKAAKGTVNERPLKFRDATGTLFNIGNVNPDFTLSVSSSFQWKQVSASAVLQRTQGGKIYNYTRQWPFNEQRDAVYDQTGKPAAERKPVTYYQAFYNNFDTNDYFVEDGSYTRLREASLYYSLPKGFAEGIRIGSFTTARLGIIGRNLWTSTKYSGYDPDVSGPGGGNPFGYRVDYFTYPTYRTFTFVLELGY